MPPRGWRRKTITWWELGAIALMNTPPDVLVWPEAAVPDMLRYEPEVAEAIGKLITREGWTE